MKRTIAIAALLGLAACNQGNQAKAPTEVKLDSESAKFSYAIGQDIGQSLKQLGSDIDRKVVILAMNEALDGKQPRLTHEEAAKIKQEVFMRKAQEHQAERTKQGEANKAAGEKFLAENAKKEGVTTTASGLQYEVLKQGDGPKPAATDTVKVNYRGTLLDGTEFDSSYKRGEPVTFPLNQVIPGWTEGVQLMNVGSKYKFFIPSDLAYGERGAGDRIGPNETLIFEVELLGIEGK